jgi:hypothetical protein
LRYIFLSNQQYLNNKMNNNQFKKTMGSHQFSKTQKWIVRFELTVSTWKVVNLPLIYIHKLEI